MSTTDQIDAPSESTSEDVQYEYTSTKAVRGTEGRTIAKWQKDGWELHTQTPGTLRTEITFRRVKPKSPWQQLVAVLAPLWAFFARLKPRTRLLLAVSCGLVVLGLVAGIVLAGVLGKDAAEPAASASEAAAPTEAAVPSEAAVPTEAAVPGDQAAEAPGQAPAPAPAPGAAPYVYQGPRYEVVVADENLGPAQLTQYWVLTSPLDYSTDEYKNPLKLIIADVARSHGSTDLLVEIVTDREVAEAEAFSTFEAFIQEHGSQYAIENIPQKEVEHWAASYRGGFDPNTGQASTSADAYEVVWRPYATSEIEAWQPAIDG